MFMDYILVFETENVCI